MLKSLICLKAEVNDSGLELILKSIPGSSTIPVEKPQHQKKLCIYTPVCVPLGEIEIYVKQNQATKQK